MSEIDKDSPDSVKDTTNISELRKDGKDESVNGLDDGTMEATDATEAGASAKESSAEHEKEQDTSAPWLGRGNSLFPVRPIPSDDENRPVHLSTPDLRKDVLENGTARTGRQETSTLLLASRPNKSNKVAAVVAQPRSLLAVSPTADLKKTTKETKELTTDETNDKDDTSESASVKKIGEERDDDNLNLDGHTEDDGVSTGLVSVGLASGVVTYSAASEVGDAEARIEPKKAARRKMSLNPRVMCPPGLEVLKNKGTLVVRQRMDVDIMEGCGAPNSYMVWDLNDDQIFFAGEASSCFCRWVCGPNRGFTLELFSVQEDLVLSLHRSGCRCDCCCCLDCFMCLQKMYVADCLGRTLGAIKQRFSVVSGRFDIVDHDDNVIFKIRGPSCSCRCCTEIFFRIFDHTGKRQVGRIQKKWGGDRIDNINVDHEYFDIRFPTRLHSVDKALIVAAAFLVNYMYFEMS